MKGLSMFMKLLTLIAVSALVLVTGCCSMSQSAAWEYRVIRGVAHSSELQDKLNQAGSEGFAFASSQTLPGDANTSPVTTVILKKAK